MLFRALIVSLGYLWFHRPTFIRPEKERVTKRAIILRVCILNRNKRTFKTFLFQISSRVAVKVRVVWYWLQCTFFAHLHALRCLWNWNMGVIYNLQFLPLGGSSADGTKTEKLELMEKLMEKLELMSLRENKFRITSQSKRVLSSFSSFRT